jgi:SAM-dependent methyltransferase
VLTEEQRARTLERFEAHRRAWQANEPLRVLYGEWYGRVEAALPSRALGPMIELGSGPGFSREFIPAIQLSDVVKAPWHDHEISAAKLPLPDGSVGALVLFDVLHHLESPGEFFAEAERVLVPGGRVVLCEPYMSLLSYPVYKLFHEEPVRFGTDPLADGAGVVVGVRDHEDGRDKDPFDSNQAVPTMLFCRARGRAAFARRFPRLALSQVEILAGPSYVASGGFGRPLPMPVPVWELIHRLERMIPSWCYRLIGFRLMAVIEKLG